MTEPDQAPHGGIVPIGEGEIRVVGVRHERVVLDADLAAVFGVETRVFNQAFKRNQHRFPVAWAFELTEEEFEDLKSQSVIPTGTWGGRRTLPWVFTEHGVVMAASLLTSDKANAAMQFVVDVFVRARRGELSGRALRAADSKAAVAAGGGAVAKRLQGMIERLLDTMADHENQRTLRDEAQEVFKESIGYIKAKLGKTGFENEEIAARATKLLAEAEATRASAAKTRAEADDLQLRTLARKLALVLEAEQAMARGEMVGFLKVLRELGKA